MHPGRQEKASHTQAIERDGAQTATERRSLSPSPSKAADAHKVVAKASAGDESNSESF